MTIKILIDKCFERNTITHETATYEKEITWGPNTYIVELPKQVKKRIRDDELFRIEQQPYIKKVCDHAREDKLSFFSSHELIMEGMRQKSIRGGLFGNDLLQGIKRHPTKSPIDRTIVIGTHYSYGTTEQEQSDFFKSIKSQRYLELKSIFTNKNDDAFHLWTAEYNGLDFFLTMDQKFLN